MSTKICIKCRKEYPLDSKHFHKDKGFQDGFKARCKFCINGNKFKIEKPEFLHCKKCNRELPLTNEYFVINPKSGKLTSPCRECRNLDFVIPKSRKKLYNCNENEKICSSCFRTLPKNSNYFYKNSSTKDGFTHKCRECFGKDFIKILNVETGYKLCNKCNTILPATSSYFYKDNNKDDKLATICRNCRKEYNQNNKFRRSKYVRERKEKDLEFKILNSLRNRLYHAIKGNTKSASTVELLGCSVESFIKHIEKKMSEKMSWNNYGKVWHIDHIIPCKFFDLKNKSEQLECFNYKNMQPLFRIENLQKQAYNKNEVVYKTSEYFKYYDKSNEKIIINEK